jgi:hypothetical protein
MSQEELQAELDALRAKCADLGERATQATCCDPRFVKRNEQGEPVAWTITLNEYQRANLIWLLCDVAGYDRKGEAIVSGLQTGDWAGEIPNALRCHEHDFEFEESAYRPNVSAEELREQVRAEAARARRGVLTEAVEVVKDLLEADASLSAEEALEKAVVALRALLLERA